MRELIVELSVSLVITESAAALVTATHIAMHTSTCNVRMFAIRSPRGARKFSFAFGHIA